MSIFDKDLISGKDKIEIAIGRIKTFCTNKKVYCAFSGGKDSQCCYHLCQQADIPFHAEYSITRFEPPELIQFVRDNYPNVTFRRSFKRSLVKDIEYNGLPTRFSRWCCDAKHSKVEGYDISVIGIRAEESPRRRDTWRMFGRKQDGTPYVCPIIDWTSKEVWEYLNHIGAPHCKMYDEGYDRIGCILCPLTMKNRNKDAERYPKHREMLRKGAELFVKRMQSQGFKTKKGKMCPSWHVAQAPVEEYWQRWLQTAQTVKSVEEEMGKRTEDDMCLFAGTGFSEGDGLKTEED